MKTLNIKISLLISVILFTLSACVARGPFENELVNLEATEELPHSLIVTVQPNPDGPASPDDDYSLGLTYQQMNGNRLVDGGGSLTATDPVIIELEREITWLVGLPSQDGSLWTAALDNGEIVSFIIHKGRIEAIDLGRGPLPAGMPPMILSHQDDIFLNMPPSPEASNLTHPVSPNSDTGRVVFITETGDLVLWEHGEVIDRLEINALPDARLIQDELGRLLILSDSTNRYEHGVLGDGLEAGSITLVDTHPTLTTVNKIKISAPAVIEGIAPLWADLDGDGKREILVTVSDPQVGAKLVLFNDEGDLLAEGPSAGQGYRWRHQLAAAPMGPSGEILIIDVLRPHLDATVEFFSWQGDQLVLEADLAGFSSHRIGSRNLDMALVGDLNGDGAYEVVVPDTSQESLNGIGFIDGKAELLWTVYLGGRLTSNLSGVWLEDGSLSLGAGVGNRLLIWE